MEKSTSGAWKVLAVDMRVDGCRLGSASLVVSVSGHGCRSRGLPDLLRTVIVFL